VEASASVSFPSIDCMPLLALGVSIDSAIAPVIL